VALRGFKRKRGGHKGKVLEKVLSAKHRRNRKIVGRKGGKNDPAVEGGRILISGGGSNT